MAGAGVVFGLISLGVGIGSGAPLAGLVMFVVFVACGVAA